jgi:protease-4
MVETSDLTGSATLYVVVVVAAVLVGAVLAPIVYSTASGTQAQEPEPEPEPAPAVAVISLKGPINAQHVDAIREDLREARQNDTVEAVVLEIDSPGGGAAASEQLYLAVKRTSDEMPVVAAVTGAAASGGYYGIAPADAIYVTPASNVGSIGVFAQTFPPGQVPDSFIRSSPDKATLTKEQVSERVEALQRVFVSTVMTERGDRLELSRNEVAHARTYLGVRAVENGMADRIGGVSAAVDHAATEAELEENYTVHYKQKPRISFGVGIAQADGEAVLYDKKIFGYEGVRTTQYYMLWGTVETRDNEVKINASG